MNKIQSSDNKSLSNLQFNPLLAELYCLYSVTNNYQAGKKLEAKTEQKI